MLSFFYHGSSTKKIILSILFTYPKHSEQCLAHSRHYRLTWVPCPPNSHIEPLTVSTSEYDYICVWTGSLKKWLSQNQAIDVDPNPTGWCVSKTVSTYRETPRVVTEIKSQGNAEEEQLSESQRGLSGNLRCLNLNPLSPELYKNTSVLFQSDSPITLREQAVNE